MSRKFHRRIGISSFIFLLIFVITGLLLQHTPGLHLDRHYIPAVLSKSLYSAAAHETIDYKTDSHWISQAGSFLYIDGIPIPYIELNSLQGAVESKSYIWVVADNKLWLLSKQGEIVDEFSFLSGLPSPTTKIGRASDGTIIIRGLHQNWQAKEDTQAWQAYHGGQVIWATPDQNFNLPEHIRESVFEHVNAHLISWERVLLDVHSGRLFGVIGIVIADLAALLLLFLAATGIFLWLKRA